MRGVQLLSSAFECSNVRAKASFLARLKWILALLLLFNLVFTKAELRAKIILPIVDDALAVILVTDECLRTASCRAISCTKESGQKLVVQMKT